MAKNMTRKSIASGAAIALGIAALTGMPANAATSSISITPLSGTNNNFLADTGMVLAMTAVGAGSAENIEFKVDGAVASDFTAVDFGADTDLDNIDELADFDVDATVATLSASDNTSVITPSGNWTAGEYNVLYMVFDESEVTTATSITITPFRDDVVNDSKPTASEETFASYTFTVHPADTLTPTVSISDPGIGTGTASALVTFPGPNMASIIEAGTLGSVKFVRNGNEDTNTFSQSDYDSTKGGYVVASDSLAYAKDDVIVATSYILDETSGSASATVTVAGSVIDGMSAISTSGDDYTGRAQSGGANGTSNSTTDAIRAGAGSFSVSVDPSAVTGKSAAGSTVTFTVSEKVADNLSGTITAGGKTLANAKTGSVETISVETTVDSGGTASLDLTYAGLKNTDTFTITATAEGTTGEESSSVDPYTVVKTLFHRTVVNDFYGNAVTSIANGSSNTFRVHFRDNFNTALTASSRLDYRIQGGSSDITGTTSPTTAGYVDVSWTDNNTADDTDITFDVTDVDVLTSGSYASQSYTSGGDNLVAIDSFKSLDTASRLALSNLDDTGISLASSTLKVANERISDATAQALTENFTVTVYGESGAALGGVPVTCSSPDLQFGDAGADPEITGLGSLTLNANDSGVVDFYYNSNVAGKPIVTCESGSASESTESGDITFAAAASSAGSSISFAGSDNTAVSGGSFQVVATLTDKFGNPVEVTSSDTERVALSYSGKGITQPSTLPSITDSKGQMKFSVLLGSNDTGDATVTMTYDKNADGDLTDLGDLAVSYTVDVNPTASGVEYGTMSAWTVNQDDGTAKVYVKFPTIGEKVRIGHQTGGSGAYETIYVKTTTSETMDGLRIVEGVGTYVVRTIDLESGTNRIRVTVGDSTEVQVRYNE